MTHKPSSKSKPLVTLFGVAGLCLLAMALAFFQPSTDAQAAAELSAPFGPEKMNNSRADLKIANMAPASMGAAAAITPITPITWTPPSPAYKIYVEADGLYRLDYIDLETAGLPVDALDPTKFQMYYMGREFPIEVEGESDNVFHSEDAIVFYGRSVDSLYYEGYLPDHKYAGANVYWLTYDQAPGMRMGGKDGSVPGTPSLAFEWTERFEPQKAYFSARPKYGSNPRYHPEDERWYTTQMQTVGGSVRSGKTYFRTRNASTADTYSMTMTVHVVGDRAGGHGLRMLVNGAAVFEASSGWKNLEPATFQAEVPQSQLSSGTNNYQIEFFVVDADPTAGLIDWVELTHFREYSATNKLSTPNDVLLFSGEAGPGPWEYTISEFTTDDIRVYDVTDLFDVARIQGTTIAPGPGPYTVRFGDNENERRYASAAGAAFLAPTDIELVTHLSSIYTPSRVKVVNSGEGAYSLLDEVNGADWILITHRDFWDEVMPLADHRAKKYRVAVIDVQEIYDQFNGGLMSAESIHDFLEYTYHHWDAAPPEFVLLGGGGTNDMRHYYGNTKPTFIPPFLVPVDPTLGETAADNRFVTFLNDDILPDMTIGRFPGFDEFAMSTMVAKSIHYETTPLYDDWNTKLLMIADDREGGGGDFYGYSDTLIYGSADPAQPDSTKFMPEPYTATKVYLAQTCDDYDAAIATECRAVISDTLNSEGALFTSYIGHAQIKNWASEKLMDQVLASSLTNYDKLSIFLAMACFEGFFFDPAIGSYSLAETYMTNPNGGAVASWSPTGFGVATGHDWLEQGLFLAIFQDEVTNLGSAMDQAKYYMVANEAPYPDLLDTFMLFGDPALQVQVYVDPTAVDIAAFSAVRHEDTVTVAWQTVNEVDIAGFNILRSDSADGDYSTINGEPILAKYPGSPNGALYELQDQTALPEQTYWYKLEALIQDGTLTDAGTTELITAAANPQIFLPIVTR